MLRPQDTMTRETKRLDGIWDFVVDFAGVGRQQRWWERPLAGGAEDAGAEQLQRCAGGRRRPRPRRRRLVPADGVRSAGLDRNAHASSGSMPPPIGPGSGSTTWGSSSTKGDTRHSRSTSPTSSGPGESFRLTVVVNNELTWESIPPGTIETKPDGVRRQHYYHDFFNYAGLHRSVWIYATPRSLHRRHHRRHGH